MPRARSQSTSAPAPRREELEAQTEDFLSLWLPFELAIGRLSQSTSASDSQADGRKQLKKRRAMLERLFIDAEDAKPSAVGAMSALETVMEAFAARVEIVVRRGELDGELGGEEPGKVALSQLGNEADFLKLATAYAAALHGWLFEAVEKSEATGGKTLGRRPGRLPAILHFFNDAPHGVTVRGLAQVGKWKPSDEFAYAYDQIYADARVTLGLRDAAGVQDLWAYLVKGGPRMVKAHYALWARYYEDVDEGGMRYAMISVPQFCADLGYTPHKNGGFRPEHKREALKMLEALTSIEMSVVKNLKGKERRIRGPLWARGFEAQERDQFGDLFGANRVGNPDSWEPIAFSFAPGPWFDDPEWRRYHRFIGKIGSGLLRLSGHTDQWPILIGGYLGTLARVGGYKTLRLKVGTILKNLDLAQGDDQVRRVSQTREKLERALDRLAEAEIGVISDWSFANCPEIIEPDMDNPNDLTQYGQNETHPEGDWRGWIVQIDLPFKQDALRIESNRVRAIKTTKSRARKKDDVENGGSK